MIKERYLITKRVFQIFLYLLEVIGVPLVLTSLSNKFWKTENFIDFLERMTIFYTFYQIIIYGILQHLNDIKKDEYLALLTMYKYIEIYNLDKRKSIKDNIINIINNQLDSSTFNDNNIRQEYLEIKKILDDNKGFDETILKTKIIKYEHCCEEAVLNWKYSILTRIFKQKIQILKERS